MFIFRQAEVQRLIASNLFYTPGIYYRPETLKAMTALLGNTEKREIYENFCLENLNSNAQDYTHELYRKYLEANYFIPAHSKKNYWSHMETNRLPGTPSKKDNKGLFNIFPLSLTSDALVRRSSSSSSIGGQLNSIVLLSHILFYSVTSNCFCFFKPFSFFLII